MSAPPSDYRRSSPPLRVVTIDDAGEAIPGRPHIVLARPLPTADTPRLALADSGLLDQLSQALPVQVVEKPSLRLVSDEASEPRPPGGRKPPSRGRRRSKPVGSDDEPEGAA